MSLSGRSAGGEGFPARAAVVKKKRLENKEEVD